MVLPDKSPKRAKVFWESGKQAGEIGRFQRLPMETLGIVE